MTDILEYLNSSKKYYIYGTTSLGVFFYKKIVNLYGDESIVGFLETKPIIQRYFDKKVISPAQIENLEKNMSIIIASATHCNDMVNELLDCGIPKEQIIVPYKIFDYFKTFYGWNGKKLQNVCFWPPISENETNLLKKIAWFLPDKIEVSIWLDDTGTQINIQDNVCIKKLNETEDVFRNTQVIFLWNTLTKREEFKNYLSKVLVVDPNFYSYIETLNYCKLYYTSFDNYEMKEYENVSKKIFLNLRNDIKNKNCSKARIFCSGSSIEEVYENTYKDSINIICNSMVKDKDWLKRIKPDILTFIDVNYFFSPTDYCKTFMEDVLEAQRLYGCYIFVLDYEVPLLLKHYPELSGKVIGLASDSMKFTELSESNLNVRNTRNILTEMMLPIASSFADRIEIIGCTGRNPDENFYWKHNGRMQYLELIPTINDMYPSIFRDQDYANYYDYHCQCVEEFLKYGEERGKKYINSTTSYIPALKKRTISKTE